MAIDPTTICKNVEPCVADYYRYSNFLREERAINYGNWWAAFVWMLFLHKPWIVFGGIALWEVIEELSVALSVWLQVHWIRLKSEWDAADTMLDLLVAIVGITAAMLLIWMLSLPRLVRLPYLEIAAFQREYHIERLSIERVKRYTRGAYRWLSWKYGLELFVIIWLPSLAFLLEPKGFAARESDLDRRWLRPDWLIFTLLQGFLILLSWILNWLSPIERDILWNNDRAAYNSFHIGWISVLALLMSPFVYTVLYPKTALMLGSVLVYLLLVPLTIRSMVSDGRLPRLPSLLPKG